MKISRFTAYRRAAGIGAGCVLGGMAIGIVGTTSAAAAPDCSPEGVQGTVSTATGTAWQYIDSHPGADLRNYVTTYPDGDTERQCNVTVLPPNLESAYHQFMAG
jgi:heme-binding protein